MSERGQRVALNLGAWGLRAPQSHGQVGPHVAPPATRSTGHCPGDPALSGAGGLLSVSQL